MSLSKTIIKHSISKYGLPTDESSWIGKSKHNWTNIKIKSRETIDGLENIQATASCKCCGMEDVKLKLIMSQPDIINNGINAGLVSRSFEITALLTSRLNY